MKLQTFKKLIELIREDSDRSQKFYDLGLDLSNVEDLYRGIITMLLKAHFGEQGEDMISWWLYEDVDKYLYKTGTEEICNDLTTVEALWEYVEDLRKNHYEEPDLVPPMTTEQKQQLIESMFNATTPKSQIPSLKPKKKKTSKKRPTIVRPKKKTNKKKPTIVKPKKKIKKR